MTKAFVGKGSIFPDPSRVKPIWKLCWNMNQKGDKIGQEKPVRTD